MKQFEFRLESVLLFRRQQAAADENRFAAMRTELQRCEDEVERIRSERTANKERLLKEFEPMALLLGATDSYSEFLHVRERFAAVRVRECQRKVDLQRLRLLEAQRQTKLLEMLKEKARLGWMHEENRQDDAMAADAYVASYLRRKRRESSPSESLTEVFSEPLG